MAATHRCPEDIVRLFDVDGGEPAKRVARVRAIEWLEAQTLGPGDVVFMPNPNTGVMESWAYDEKPN